MGVTFRTPPKHRSRFFGAGEAQRLTWNGVRAVCNAFDKGVIDAIMYSKGLKGGAFHDGLSRYLVIPTDDSAGFIQAYADLVANGRTIVAATDVVFAIPNQFHWERPVGHEES